MKKTLIMLLALSVLAVSSCDFVRTLAGRPTQAQLDRMRAERNRQEEARHQATLDSMARVEKHMADSLEALEKHLLDSLTQSQGTVLNPSKLGGLFTTKLENKYYIVVGAFRTRSNAENKLKSCNAGGLHGHHHQFPERTAGRGHLPVQQPGRDAAQTQGDSRDRGLPAGRLDSD